MIYGFAGKKGHGKDSLARLVSGVSHEPWVVTHFADPLKRQVQEIFGLTEYQLYDTVGKEEKFTAPLDLDAFLAEMRQVTGLPLEAKGLVAENPRKVFQLFGTNYVKAFRSSYWYDQLEPVFAGNRGVMVADLRFLDEAAFLRKHNAFIVKIVRLDLQESGDTHASEAEVEQIVPDLLLGTITDRFALQARVASLLAEEQLDVVKSYDYRAWTAGDVPPDSEAHLLLSQYYGERN